MRALAFCCLLGCATHTEAPPSVYRVSDIPFLPKLRKASRPKDRSIAQVSSVELRQMKFPELAGSYDVAYAFFGRRYKVEKLYPVYKESLLELYGPERKLSYAVLYPAQNTSQRMTLSDVLPATETFNAIDFRIKAMFDEYVQYLPGFNFENLLSNMDSFYKSVPLNVFKNGIVESGRKFPVLIFSPGASGQRETYLGLLEQIASLGVIVVALDQHGWEVVPQAIYDENLQTYQQYLRALEFEKMPYAGDGFQLALRAEDVHEAYTDIRRGTNSIFRQADLSKIFIAGHSHGGHTSFYSIRLGMQVQGYINLDGSFAPENSELDGYDSRHIKENVHLLCVDESIKEDGPKICNQLLDSFKTPNSTNTQNQLDSFKFQTLDGWGNISHNDFGNLTLFDELFPGILDGERHLRPSTRDIWHRMARWVYKIVE